MSAERRVRSALITGASRGIGLGVARRLARRGFALTIAARDEDRLADAAAQLWNEPNLAGLHWLAGDVMDDDYLSRLVASHQERHDSLDALVLNAGAGSAGRLADFHPKRFDKQIAVNLRSAFVLTQNALPLLRSAAVSSDRGAKVVAMASITGRYAEADLAAYGAAKAGLMSLCRSINLEENANGIQATALAPGYVDTDMADFKHDVLAADDMIPVEDVVELVDMCLRLSRRSVVPEVVIARSGTSALSA
ncbi:SDR family oxidoreductase [Mycolicibacterium boenickei]|nr:SDR family oxidoreductase [Mycolicibacterium boenickei]